MKKDECCVKESSFEYYDKSFEDEIDRKLSEFEDRYISGKGKSFTEAEVIELYNNDFKGFKYV